VLSVGLRNLKETRCPSRMRAAIHPKNSREPPSCCRLGADPLPLIFELKIGKCGMQVAEDDGR